MIFADASALHSQLLAFTAESTTCIEYQGNTYNVEHSQFAKYSIRDLFRSLMENTTHSPGVGELTDHHFEKDAIEALTQSDAYVNSDAQHTFEMDAYVDEQELKSAISDYEMRLAEESNDIASIFDFEPHGRNKAERVAEILSLLHANRTSLELIGGVGSHYTSNKDSNTLNTDANPEHVQSALIHTVRAEHGPSVLSRPDPSLRTTRELYHMYDEVGVEPTVKSAYALFVTPQTGTTTKTNTSGLLSGHGKELTRWTSDNEPPLTTLDSYD